MWKRPTHDATGTHRNLFAFTGAHRDPDQHTDNDSIKHTHQFGHGHTDFYFNWQSDDDDHLHHDILPDEHWNLHTYSDHYGYPNYYQFTNPNRDPNEYGDTHLFTDHH